MPVSTLHLRDCRRADQRRLISIYDDIVEVAGVQPSVFSICAATCSGREGMARHDGAGAAGRQSVSSFTLPWLAFTISSTPSLAFTPRCRHGCEQPRTYHGRSAMSGHTHERCTAVWAYLVRPLASVLLHRPAAPSATTGTIRLPTSWVVPTICIGRTSGACTTCVYVCTC